LKLDKCWKPRVVAALRAQEPDDHDPGKEKRYKTALEKPKNLMWANPKIWTFPSISACNYRLLRI